MDTSQIWRFPKKYAELFKNLSNEDTWIIIKELFFWNWDNLEWLNKAYYDIIKIDLDNLEKSAINGKKWGRPKKEEIEITPGYENKKPLVIKNDNLKKREREREREKESKIEIYRKFKHLEITQEEFEKLNITYSKEVIDDVLDSIENFKDNKKYNSLYLTANKWLKKENIKTIEKPKINFNSLLD